MEFDAKPEMSRGLVSVSGNRAWPYDDGLDEGVKLAVSL